MILATNILSEMMRGDPSGTVSAWLATCHDTTLGIAAVTVQEMTFGLRRMAGRVRQQRLAAAWDRILTDLTLYVHPLDLRKAEAAALLQVQREKRERHLGVADAQIAATALVLGRPLVTRNVRDVDGLGLDLVDPWGDDRP